MLSEINMPYFIILPVYMVLLFVLVGAAILTRWVPIARSASGYIVGGMVGSLIGFILANALLMLLGLIAGFINPTVEGWLQTAFALIFLSFLMIGPFVASVFGVFVGFALGLNFVFRRRRKRATMK